MKLIAGLGNPGKEYANTRHNSGFLAMDRLCEKAGVDLRTEKWNALVAKTNIGGTPVLFMKPLTFMNESGSAVSQAVRFYHIDPKDILVLHDDMDLPTGTVRIRKNGSAGGQKGMKSIIDCLKTSEIARIRIGVGHSRAGEHDLVPDWVLSPVPKAEKEIYETALQDAAEAAYAWVNDTMDNVMNRYNLKPKKK
jgi:PTH1 family peptidyl-tRNA hydrolase